MSAALPPDLAADLAVADNQAALDLAEALAQHPRHQAADQPEVRATWWRLRCAGAELPAEPGVIAIRGVRR